MLPNALFGMLIGAHTLHRLHSPKGKIVFAHGYRDIVAQIPHIQHQTPTWILV
ncbi:MAG: hypothetical protein AAGD06_06610 [Acidobacteriota bacterium]